MKTVFRSNEIAHVWFHANAPHGKSPGSMSFDGDVFRSYNTAIARKVTHKGKCAVILNDRSFSNTTCKHKNRMMRAIPHDAIRFHFDDGMGTRLEVSPKQLFDYAIERAAGFLTLALALCSGRRGAKPSSQDTPDALSDSTPWNT